MAKTETNVSTLKINRGTYAKVQENLSSITENELIITSDKNVPIPTTNDNGKAVVVNASGEYELGNAGTNVVANPTLAGTESALTGLQVGDTKYAVPVGYEVHTYAENTTYSGADYTQIKDDVTNKRDMIISGRYYRYVETEATIYSKYISIAYDSTGKYITTYYTSIVDNTTSMTINSAGTIANYQCYNLLGDQARLLYAIQLGQWGYNFVGKQVAFSTTAPTADNTSGYLDIRVLSSEPATRYNGYLYFILS